MASDFYASQTTSVPRGDGTRDVTISDNWNTPLGKPNGGYILALMLRGLGDEIDHQNPLVAAVTYLSSPSAGPAELTTTDIKRGARLHTASATLIQDDRTIAHLVTNFARNRSGRTEEFDTAPILPDPDACIDPFAEGFARDGIFNQIDYRLSKVPGWASGTPNGEPNYSLWQRLRGGQAIDFPALGLLCDSFAPPVMELGELASVTLQLTVHLHRLPEPGWIATRLSTKHVVNGFHEEDCELWDQAGNLVAQSRQLSILLS